VRDGEGNNVTAYVVAVDGSEGAAEALRWAIDMADVHDATLTAVMAWSWLDQPDPASFSPAYTEDDAKAELAGAVQAAGSSRPIAQEVVCDLPVSALERAAEGADLLIVGARGHGGFAGLGIGSVSERLLEVAPCPVAVVHAGAVVAKGRVVVGVDGSDPSREALHWAAAEAAARDADLDVVQAWGLPVSVASPYDGIPDIEQFEAGERELLRETMRDPALKGLRATGHLVAGGASRALLERAGGAALVVVGSRGRGRLLGAILGSTSRQVVHHATCPVVVLRDDKD
jgi:nucleotide-binding universal stress UspA family protein